MSPNLHEKLDKYLAGDNDFRLVYDYTNQRFDAAPHLTGHNFEHARRDTINSIAIGEPEAADMTIVLPAIVMHDIGFLYGATGKTHGAVGAKMLDEYLAVGNISLDSEKLESIRACILTHKGSMHGEEPMSLEAKVVSDADMLEKFGPIGVYQNIRTFGEFNYDVQRIINSLSKFEILTLTTKTGQEIAQKRQSYVSDFAKELELAYAPYVTETDLTL